MALASPPIIIAIGGQGSRIGGDKAERLLGGERLIDHMLRWARGQSDLIALAVRASCADADMGTGLPTVADAAANLGPISALDSAMRFASQHGRNHVLLVSCDMPFLPDDLLARLSHVIGEAGAALPDVAGRVQPLAALWRVDCAALHTYIAGGGQSLWRYAEQQGMERLPGRAADFANINTPEELAAAEQRFKRGAR
ncbi:MAG: molybdenum cofactor guanylyltransferase [Sphingomonadaceae bacterium]|nr:molybdenum cofactor guanylyltransferase [Sphingomonadaceae bacterium]